jgi:hypothetical protein
MLMRKERLKPFGEMWRQANLDYYQTQDNRRKILPKQSEEEGKVGKKMLEKLMEEQKQAAKQ